MRKVLEETLKEIKQDARGALKLLYKYPNWGVLSGYDAAKTEARVPLPDGHFLDQAKGLSITVVPQVLNKSFVFIDK